MKTFSHIFQRCVNAFWAIMLPNVFLSFDQQMETSRLHSWLKFLLQNSFLHNFVCNKSTVIMSYKIKWNKLPRLKCHRDRHLLLSYCRCRCSKLTFEPIIDIACEPSWILIFSWNFSVPNYIQLKQRLFIEES